jgi:hypothetical protein
MVLINFHLTYGCALLKESVDFVLVWILGFEGLLVLILDAMMMMCISWFLKQKVHFREKHGYLVENNSNALIFVC